MESDSSTWNEDSSRWFLEFGDVVTPNRDRIRDVILDLIPASEDGFLVVDVACGGGWLSAAVLERFPSARVLGLDGSPAMLEQAAAALAPYGGRFELRRFELADPTWIDTIDGRVCCFVSSLAIHHLDGPGKQALYRMLASKLDERGAVLIADLIAPASEAERRYLARSWDEAVRRQSTARGAPGMYQQFLDQEWNYFRYPDPTDQPSTIPDHLRWLAEAGLTGSNVFRLEAGHAVYGGFKSGG